MPRRRLLPALAAALALACATAASADTAVLQLDPQATRVNFHFGATFKGVRGNLSMREGQITLLPENGLAAGRIVLDLTSAETGVVRRDRKMRDKILETPTYPLAAFYPERIDGHLRREGTSDIQLHGRLDFHGASHEVGIVSTATAHGDQVTANGFFSIPYISWGLRDPSFFILRVAKEVQVEIHAVGRLIGGSLEPDRPAAGSRR
jgi:polyisoprenoid-binding protein YceI